MKWGWPVALVAVFLVGCGASTSSGNPELTVYVSSPTSGPAAAEGRDIADGARLALAQSKGKAGDAKVRARYLDDATGGARLDPVKVAENARLATEDSSTAAYIGELDSGATRTSLPITNGAGILQVSPTSGADRLARSEPFSQDVPKFYQGSGTRSYATLVPSDVEQGVAGARLLDSLPGSGAIVVSDGSDFAQELQEGFQRQHAFEGAPPNEKPSCETALSQARHLVAARAPRKGGAPARPVAHPRVYVAAEPDCTVRALEALEPLAPDASIVTSDALRDAGTPPAAVSGVHMTSAVLGPDDLAPSSGAFTDAFSKRFGRQPGPYAAYGYEAMRSVLSELGGLDDPTDRGALIDAYIGGSERNSILGRYAISETGQTTLDAFTDYLVTNRRFTVAR